MQCGAKCFVIQVEQNGKVKEKSVIARTPAKARRVIRKKLGSNAAIISVTAQRN